MSKYTKMIVCSGGINGIAIVGALYNFILNNDISNIKTFMGISVGSLITMLLTTGYDKDEIMNLFLDIEMKDFSDFKISRFLQDYGLDNGENIKRLLKAILMYKNFSPDLTFKELYDQTGNKLIIIGTNVNKGVPIYYNIENYPNTKIVDAIRVSSSFPGVYTPVIENNHHLIDGAILEPYPLHYFDNKDEVIGFLIKNNIPSSERLKEYKIDSLKSYYMSIINILLDAYLEKCFDGKHKHTIYIDKEDLKQDVMDFNLTKDVKHSLVDIGKKAFEKYYNKIKQDQPPDLKQGQPGPEQQQLDQKHSDSNN
jgi:NTE family protein